MKTLPIYLAAFFVFLALTWLPIEIGAIALLAIAMGLGFAITFSAWWRMIVGGIVCIGVCYAFVVWCLINKYKTDYYEPTEAREWMQYWLQCAIPMGAFVGGSFGLHLYYTKQKPSEPSL